MVRPLKKLFSNFKYHLVQFAVATSFLSSICCTDIFPIKNIDNYKLYLSINKTGKKYSETDQRETSLVLKPSKKLN